MLTEQEKQFEEYKTQEELLQDMYGKLMTSRKSKRLVEKSLGKESFSDKLKRQMKEKRLNN